MSFAPTHAISVLATTAVLWSSCASEPWKKSPQETELSWKLGIPVRNEIQRDDFQIVRITGEVHRPGRVMWQNGMTLGAVIEASGGFTGFAGNFVWTTQQTNIVKLNRSKYLEEPMWAEMPVIPGDSVQVNRVCNY